MLSEKIVAGLTEQLISHLFVQVEASGRHVHLCRSDIDQLFGAGYQLTRIRDLSQPGQYVCEERISVTGPKGTIKNVVVLGPERKETQIEISMTDGLALGIKAPIRQSGQIHNTPGATLSSEKSSITINQGVIVAKRHIHLHPDDAARFQLQDNEIIKIKVFGDRSLIFDEVVARVNKNFKTSVHIDYDEANGCGFKKDMLGIILK
ncbi:MAG TPA: phosphate propanoyltransferase [Candidatus Merdenecus merdavium]|nr:phosphate propanoyltransferase [Candidatus Merdenecus merdavium]